MPRFEINENEYEYNLRDPKEFEADSLTSKKIDKGVKLVIGKVKGQDKMMAKSILFVKGVFPEMENAQKWIDENGGPKAFKVIDGEVRFDMDDPEFGDIKGVEIFAEGVWNGDQYTEKDLETIAQSFKKTRGILKPYLKLGHGDDQKLLAVDELPAAGFISNVYRDGKKLLADFTRVPKKIYELIKRKAYSRISSELFVNLRSGGAVYPLALKAVALLGGETPAVHTLNDILSLYASNDDLVMLKHEAEKTKECEIDIEHFNLKHPEDEMTIDELNRQNAKLEAELKSQKDENAELEKELKETSTQLKQVQSEIKEFKDKNEALVAEIEKGKQEARFKEIDAKVKSYVEAKKITPAQAPILTELLKKSSGEVKFTVGEKEFSSVDAMIEAFVNSKVEMKTEDGATSQGANNKGEMALIDKANKYMREHKVSFKDAMLAISPDNVTESE